jgi:hypothetical protein
MAKNNMLKKHEEEVDDFDFSEMMGSSDEEVIGFMQGILEASNNHMTLALELTKLAIEKNGATSMKEEDVFSVFKKSLGVVSESFPLKKLWEKFS